MKGKKWARNSSFEFHLIKLSSFYAAENIFTVFPDCQRFTQDWEKNGEKCTVFLMCTFQPNNGELVQVSKNEKDAEEAALQAALVKSSNVSALISYSPASCDWKDRSRLIFFDFLKEVQDALETAFPSRLVSSSRQMNEADVISEGVKEGKLFFVDGPDPASGVALTSQRGPSTISESDIMEFFFGFHSVLVATAGGGCRMIEHPSFGLNVYPASLVIAIPSDKEDELICVVNSLSS